MCMSKCFCCWGSPKKGSKLKRSASCGSKRRSKSPPKKEKPRWMPTNTHQDDQLRWSAEIGIYVYQSHASVYKITK